MKERPILFNSEMVRAVLEGRKTQTRRVIKPQPFNRTTCYGVDCTEWLSKNGKVIISSLNHTFRDFEKAFPETVLGCNWNGNRYGKAGDELWVREGHSFHPLGGDPGSPTYGKPGSGIGVYYKVEDKNGIAGMNCNDFDWCDLKTKRTNWRPSIHMPRWASRIQLRVKDVRVERVQDITNEDALDEGVKCECIGSMQHPTGDYEDILEEPKVAFERLWDSINSSPNPIKSGGVIARYESYPWAAGNHLVEHRGLPWSIYGNLWVFVVEFERIV